VEVAARAHAFVRDLDAPELDAPDRHHLERVLRLRAGDELTVGDGEGRWRRCRFGAELEPVGATVAEPRLSPPITIAFALVKGERPELIVQKLTELGVDVIVPFTAERSVVHWEDDRARRHQQRLVAVAREAAMQSRRVWLPSVEPISSFAAVAGRGGAAVADRDGEPPALDRTVLLVGPEGGWSDAERAMGLPAVRLADGILRAETAAIVGAAALCGLRSGVFRPSAGHRE
jgi:16S rRNA (uracil1498-N3)-methyltransferase